MVKERRVKIGNFNPLRGEEIRVALNKVLTNYTVVSRLELEVENEWKVEEFWAVVHPLIEEKDYPYIKEIILNMIDLYA